MTPNPVSSSTQPPHQTASIPEGNAVLRRRIFNSIMPEQHPDNLLVKVFPKVIAQFERVDFSTIDELQKQWETRPNNHGFYGMSAQGKNEAEDDCYLSFKATKKTDNTKENELFALVLFSKGRKSFQLEPLKDLKPRYKITKQPTRSN